MPALTLADALRQTGYAQDGQLQAPAPTQPNLTSILKNHIDTLPQQLATNQQAMDNTMASMYKTDMATGQPNPNYRPEAMNEFTQMMPMVGALTAWHGTPHKILGKFDISKMGTGEGAQAYGPGMYFAEAPAVADQYRKDLSAIVNYDQNTKKYQVLDKSRKVLGEYDNLQKAGQEADKAGNLYKVDIPDEQIPNMLNWDIPLNQQPTVLQSIKNLGARQDLPKGFDQAINRALENKHFDGQDLYYELTKVYKDPEMLRKAMQESGFTGIRYLDQGSRGTGKGSSNFVVFDPSEVKILEKNGVPTRKDLIQQQVDKLE